VGEESRTVVVQILWLEVDPKVGWQAWLGYGSGPESGERIWLTELECAGSFPVPRGLWPATLGL
jgi:hypothetical protein